MNSCSGIRGLAIVLALASCDVNTPVVEADYAIVHVNVVPLTGDTVLSGHSVLVRRGRVAAIVPDGAVRLAEATATIDGGGKYLLPGFVDGHAHLRARGVPDLLLSQGFTTVRSMHGGLGDPWVWQQAIDASEVVGAGVRISTVVTTRADVTMETGRPGCTGASGANAQISRLDRTQTFPSGCSCGAMPRAIDSLLTREPRLCA